MVGIKEAGRKGKGHFFQGRKRARGQLSLLLLGAVCCVRAQLVLMATADQAAACYCSTTVRPVALFSPPPGGGGSPRLRGRREPRSGGRSGKGAGESGRAGRSGEATP